MSSARTEMNLGTFKLVIRKFFFSELITETILTYGAKFAF